MLSSLVEDILCGLVFIMAAANHDGGLTWVDMLNFSLFNLVALSFKIKFSFSFVSSTTSYGISHA